MKQGRFVVFAGLLMALTTSYALAEIDYKISVEEAGKLHGQPGVVFWFAGPEASFEKAHIPGSVQAFAHDMQYLEDVHQCDGLPMCPEHAAEFIGALGIDNNTQVIAYEDGKGVNESGVWFFLTLYGHENVKMLEGGLPEWKAKGLPVESGTPKTPTAKTFKASVDKSMIATRSEVEAALGKPDVVILDARHKFTEFTGQDLKEGMKNEKEHVTVARGGHIPGAIFSPWTKYAGNKQGVAGKPFFKSKASLNKSLARLEKKGYSKDDEVITYCHVGLGRGSFQYLGLKLAGHEKVKLYAGSWSDWGSSSLPVEIK